jgi:hypothetical protein
MPEEFKYTIRKRINDMPGNYRGNLYKLCLALDVTLVSAYRWIKVKKGEPITISEKNIYKLAEFFNCKPSDLINGTPQK